jgi:hypothetical protein
VTQSLFQGFDRACGSRDEHRFPRAYRIHEWRIKHRSAHGIRRVDASFPDFGLLSKSRQKRGQTANDVVDSLPPFFRENSSCNAELSAAPKKSRDWLRRALHSPIVSA